MTSTAVDQRKFLMTVRAAGWLLLGLGIPWIGIALTWVVVTMQVAWPAAPSAGPVEALLSVLGSARFLLYVASNCGPGLLAFGLGVFLIKCRPGKLPERFRA